EDDGLEQLGRAVGRDVAARLLRDVAVARVGRYVTAKPAFELVHGHALPARHGDHVELYAGLGVPDRQPVGAGLELFRDHLDPAVDAVLVREDALDSVVESDVHGVGVGPFAAQSRPQRVASRRVDGEVDVRV